MLGPTFKLKIHLKSFHPVYMDNTVLKIKQQLKKIYVLPIKHVFLPKSIERFTVLRSPHVDKKARDQFERITHKRLIVIEIPLTLIKNRILTFDRLLQLIFSVSMNVDIQIEYEIKK